tara:strand:+ start:70 stop:1257 length:1188 start_codon:yes stop_codon:yes gene_type:complete
MFDLPENFNKNIVETTETKLKDGIINNRDIGKDIRVKTLNFLIKAKNIILNQDSENVNNPSFDLYKEKFELSTTKLEDKTDHDIQVRKETPYLDSYPSEYFAGAINPLKKRIVKKNLNIDSKFRDNYFSNLSSNFNFNLPMNMNNVVQMQLSAIELPTTYYAVSKQIGNNFFTITVNGTTTTTINLPTGNYTQTTIMDAINYQLSLATDASFSEVVFAINLENGSGSGRTMVGLAPSSSSITEFELNFQTDNKGNKDPNTPMPLKLGWLLGFRNGFYTNNLNYVSEGIVDVSGPKYLFLVVDDYNNNVNNSFYSAFNSSLLNKNILARISLTSPHNSFSTLQQNNLNIVTTPREYFGPVNIQTLNIQLLDEYGRIIDLNNMDFSLCLNLKVVYDL